VLLGLDQGDGFDFRLSPSKERPQSDSEIPHLEATVCSICFFKPNIFLCCDGAKTRIRSFQQIQGLVEFGLITTAKRLLWCGCVPASQFRDSLLELIDVVLLPLLVALVLPVNTVCLLLLGRLLFCFSGTRKRSVLFGLVHTI
jgi:hypothetical protein